MVKMYDYYSVSVNINNETYANPFDLSVPCKVTKPDGTVFEVKAYFVGEKEYVAKIYVDTLGTYKYEISFDEKVIENGEFICEKARENEHGKPMIAPYNTQKLCYQDGSAYNMLGFECDWIFLLDQDNEEDFPKARCIIDSIAENGFNMIVCNIIAMDVTWQVGLQGKGTQYDFSFPNELPFMKNGEEVNHEMLNTHFFKRMDKIMDYLKEKEIVVHLMIYVWNKFVNWPVPNSDADKRYFKHIVDRYQAYSNLIWDVSKEALSYGIVTTEDLQDKCTFIRENDKYGTLLTMHDAGFCQNNPSYVDVVSVQNWANNLCSAMFALQHNNVGKVVCNVEHGGYERGIFEGFHGAYSDPKVCLERNYICLFMGIYGVYYWQNASWNIVVWNINDFARECRPRYDYYKHLREFMDDNDYANLYQLNSEDPTRYTLTNGKQAYCYKPMGARYVNMGRLYPELKKPAKWFNPLTGEYKEIRITNNEKTYGVESPWLEEPSVLIFDIQPEDEREGYKPVLSYELEQ
ncbi:MAG: DUF4038 domain-containing protein [Clostridia bacterium]